MIIGVASKVIDRSVGGNSRYARNVYAGLKEAGHVIVKLGDASRRHYLLGESVNYPGAFKGDVVHYPADTGALVRMKTPVVATIHGIGSLHDKSVRHPLRQKIWMARTGRLAQIADQIITVSASSKNDVVNGLGVAPEKVRVIHHGIDHGRFNVGATPEADRKVLDGLGVPGEYVLYMGNIEPRKNITEIVAAMELLQGTDVPLVVAGNPAWESEPILAAMEASNKVIYVGRVAEEALVPLLRGAACFVFPSKYEGFGFPVLEAMACGTPVVCSSRGSLGEVAGNAAHIIADIGAAAIADGVAKVLEDSEYAATLTKSGLENVQRFTWENSVNEHVDTFEGVIHA